jgi:two-component system sensor histidine kinase UhpB
VSTTSASGLPIYLKVCLINGLTFAGGISVLALSPATVSSPVLGSEVVVLTVGLIVIVSANAMLLHNSLRPVDRLIRFIDDVDVLDPQRRLPVQGSGTVARLIDAFNSMLTRLEVERRSSNARAVAAQEAERHRIAQELHDEIGQGLTVVLLGLERAVRKAPTDLAADLTLIQDNARTSLDEVRDVARRLRPGVLEDLGLVSALNALATDLTTHHHVHVRRGFTPGLPALPPQTELVIYRIAQEALTNVARHAHADTVELSLTRSGDAVALRIADNGRGLNHHTEGSGMRGMHERAMLVHAELSIGPRVGGGTQVQLITPIDPST